MAVGGLPVAGQAAQERGDAARNRALLLDAAGVRATVGEPALEPASA